MVEVASVGYGAAPVRRTGGCRAGPRIGWASQPATAASARCSTLAGALLLAAVLTGALAVAPAAPAALAVALLVFGAYLLALRGKAALAGAPRRHGIAPFRERLGPGLVTDLAGRTLARNPAARNGDPLAAAFADPEARALPPDPRGAAERHRRRDRAERPRPRLVTRHGRRTLLWRIEPRRGAAVRFVACRGRRALAQPRRRRPRRRSERRRRRAGRTAAPSLDVLADLPLRPDGMHVLAETGRAVARDPVRRAGRLPRPAAHAARRRRDFRPRARPLPRRAAGRARRLETDGRLTYANTAARQLLGERALARRQPRRPDRGSRPADRRAARRHHPRPRPRPIRGRPRHRRRPGDLPAGRLHPHRARRRALAARGLLRRHRAQDPRGAVRPVAEDAGRRPARRRRRARLQQPADRDQRPLRPAADAPRRRRRRAWRPDADPPERQPRRRARAPAARLLAQADAAPDRHQPSGHALASSRTC